MNYQTLNLLFRCNKEFSHKKIYLEDFSDTECMICSYIYFNDYCSQDDVSNTLKIDKTTVGKSINSLTKKNCVVRLKDNTDKRINHLSLTEQGKQRISKLLNLHDNWLNEVLTALNKEEQEQFESYCHRLLIKAEEINKKQ